MVVKWDCTIVCFVLMLSLLTKGYQRGPVRESNPGPLAPKARIMPLDQQARYIEKPFKEMFESANPLTQLTLYHLFCVVL